MRTLSQPSMTFALSPDGRPCAGGLCTGIVDENGMLGSLRLHGLCNRRFEVLAQSAREVYSTGDAPFPYSCVVSYPETADAMPIVHEHREHPECISAVVPAVNGIAQAIAAARTAAQKCITD